MHSSVLATEKMAVLRPKLEVNFSYFPTKNIACMERAFYDLSEFGSDVKQTTLFLASLNVG